MTRNTSSEPKNLVLVTVDALRYDRVGYSGSGRGLTPVLDALGERGVTLSGLFTQAVETPVAHGALFTGRFPRVRGLRGRLFHKRLPAGVPTLPGWLRQHGYRTAGFISAYALDRNRGFDSGFDVYGDKLREPDPFYKFHVGDALIVFEALRRIPIEPFRSLRLGKRRFAVETLAAATQWLDRTPADRPYFLFCHLFDAHCEYHSPEGYRAFPIRTSKRVLREFETGKRKLTPDARSQIEQQYDLSVRHVDSTLARLFEALRARKDGRDTLVAVTADHGEGLGDHGYMLHGCELYEEEIHVPCILSSLSGDLVPTKISSLLRSVDLPPTLLRLAGLPAFPCDGSEFVDLLGGAPSSGERISFTETRHTYLEARWLRALRSSRHKYIYDALGREELYDLETDPGETKNVLEGQREISNGLLRWQHREIGTD